MSFEADDKDSKNELIDAVKENTKWLKVVAIILGEMQDLEPNEIYEELEP